MSNKADKSFLIFNPIIFVEKELRSSRIKYQLFRFLFILLNILILTSSFVIASLTTIVFSNISIKIGDWFYYSTTSIAAVVTFVTSLINFFYVKDKYQLNNRRKLFIYGEIINYKNNQGHYKNKNTKDFEIFHKVTNFIGYKKSREVENARNK